MAAPTGYIRLAGARKQKKTYLKESYSEGAFKITRPVYLTQTGEAYFYIMSPGGGYINGDSYIIEVLLEENAEAVVTTQSSTKIYKTRSNPAFQQMNIHLKSGSILEYLPDPVIAYQDSCFKQSTVVRMEKGAALIFADIFTPGWAPDGSLFSYDLLQSKMEVYMEDTLVLFDHLKLKPDEDILGIGYMEGYTHFGTMIVIDERINQIFLEEMYELLEPIKTARIGFSMLSIPGFSLRVLANTTQEIEKVLFVCHENIRKKLLVKEPVFLRKY
ncbi:urease accessory protein UreD [Bacillus sp. MRMR6]|uniref:urease accessory protein UreD n=1 Tax=Bacillus sp. MRMR6 TaxID=1928617 RepID=UPI000952C002|nr:urease accessory protein UreD [Bacillus sp. MRMR6]OLS40533.1 urease accessory protein [Bacillus sp. MRMR6]